MNTHGDIALFVIETELQYLASLEIIKITSPEQVIIFSYSESLSQKLSARGVEHIYLAKEWSGTLQKIINSEKSELYIFSKKYRPEGVGIMSL